jgi:hypothetical protein
MVNALHVSMLQDIVIVISVLPYYRSTTHSNMPGCQKGECRRMQRSQMVVDRVTKDPQSEKYTTPAVIVCQ